MHKIKKNTDETKKTSLKIKCLKQIQLYFKRYNYILKQILME